MIISRLLKLLPVYVLFMTTFALAGFGKFAGGGVPQWFIDQFGKSFLANFPGLTLSFYSIAGLEVLATLLFVASLLKGELHKPVYPLVLHLALFVSGMVFCQLGFGLRLVGEFQGAFTLFTYTVGTAVAYLYVTSVTNEKAG
jgi:hypothetical protein